MRVADSARSPFCLTALPVCGGRKPHPTPSEAQRRIPDSPMTMMTTVAFAAYPAAPASRRARSHPRRCRALGHRVHVCAAGAGAGFLRYGAREEVGTGGEFMETYGLMIDGSVGRETLTFARDTQAVALVVGFSRCRTLCRLFRGLGFRVKG